MIDAAFAANAVSWFVQLSLVVAVAATLPWLLRVHAPGVRYAYWRAVLVICLALPWLQGRITPTTVAVSTVQPLETAPPPGSPTAVSAAMSIDWVSVVASLAVAGALARMLWIAAGYVRLRRLRRAGNTCVDCTELQELREVLPTSAEVRYVPSLEHPVTFGAFSPVVLLPESLSEHTSDIRRAVLAHELLHVHRRDWAWLLLEESVRACLWFHPAVWWVVDRVQLSREELVDELAVTVTGRRRAYVEALLAFADRPPLAPAPAFARRHHLFHRVMLVSKEAAMSSTRVVLSCAVMASIVMTGAQYAVDAFPLEGVSAPQAIQDPAPRARTLKPVTPENPVPRRISYVEPRFPPELPAAHSALVVVAVTLDESGRVTDARAKKFGVVMPRRPTGSDDTRTPHEPFAREAVAAVKQWQYDPPFEGPISFDVTVPFGEFPPPPPPPPPAPARRGSATQRTPGVPPPPPPPSPSRMEPSFASTGAVRVGGNIKAPTKIKDVRAAYPPIAMAAAVQGVVIIEATIDTDGRVSDARVLRSIPLLDQAALDAVSQWEFTPTLMNGVPVPVIMTMTVNFSLSKQ